MITQSALSHGIATFAQQSRFTVASLVESGATPEQARDAIKVSSGLDISAGVLESMMVIYRRMHKIPTYRPSSLMDTVSDFQSDPLGRWHTAQTGVTGKPTTDLYKLIANQRV